MFSYAGLSWEALRGALLLTILFGIALTDARFYIIPDQFSLGGLVLGLGLAFLPGGIDPLAALLGALLGFGLLEIVAVAGKWMFKKDAMGGGDIKMMAMVGAFVGMPGVLLTIFLGALLGSVIFGQKGRLGRIDDRFVSERLHAPLAGGRIRGVPRLPLSEMRGGHPVA